MIAQGAELFTCGHSCHNLQQRIKDLQDFRFYTNKFYILANIWLLVAE